MSTSSIHKIFFRRRVLHRGPCDVLHAVAGSISEDPARTKGYSTLSLGRCAACPHYIICILPVRGLDLMVTLFRQ
jgi:hypothetical protein